MSIQQTNGAEKTAAQKSVFEGITAVAKQLEDEGYAANYKAKVLRDLAFAFRLASGGPQPGSIEIETGK